MFGKMTTFALANRYLVITVSALVFAIGIYSASHLPIDAVPDITGVQVIVNTRTGALDPAQVETTVSYPIETELAGLPGVTEVRSLSRFGLSQVVVVFEEHSDVYRARQQVSERLASVELPNGLVPEPGPISTGLGEVFMYVVEARAGSALSQRPEAERLRYLRTVHDYTIRPYLKSRVPDVAEIDVIGGYAREILIEFYPERLEAHGITLEEMISRLETLGENFGGGYIERGERQIVVRTDGRVDSLEYIRNVPVRLNVYGGSVRVRDVARVTEGHSQRVGAATYNGQEAVFGTVLMLLGANSRDVARAAGEAVAEIPLPPDVEVRPVYSRDFLVSSTIRTVLTNLAEGAFLVIAILLLLLGNIRAAILVSLAIPLSMLVAVIGMNAIGISANLMSLGAIDFGLLVDASVVIIENLLRRTAGVETSRLSVSEKLSLVRESVGEVIRPVSFGLMIIMIVYVPILSLEGIEGMMFRPMAITVLIALGASLLVALLTMPALALVFLVSARARHKEPIFFRLIQRAYKPALDFSLRHGSALALFALVSAFLSAVVFGRLGAGFVPQLGEGDLLVSFVRDPGLSLSRSVEEQKKAESILLEFGEIRHVFARIGTAESATDPMGAYMGDTFVVLEKDQSVWPEIDGRRRTVEQLRDAIRARLAQSFPHDEVTISQPIEFRFNELLEGSRADVNLRIYGQDLDRLIELQGQALQVIESLPGVEAAELDAITALRRGPVLNVRMNYDRLTRYGVHLMEVNHALETAMGGRRVGSFQEADLRVPVMLRMAEELRREPGSIARIPVGLTDGGTAPIALLASMHESQEVINIARKGSRRYAAVAIDLDGRDTLGFVEEARARIDQQLALETGYYTEWGGQFRNLERARTRLLIVVPIVMGLIFLLLLRNFQSFRQTAMVFLSVPFAATGGVLALFLRGIPFSVSAAVGLIALSGIAILNAMVMVTFFNQLRASGMPVTEAVRQGALIRLRPVVMTALVASLGFLPMAINTGLGAEVQRPLATVVIGGLVTATLLTLLLLPVLYRWIERD
ncbi:MAG: efflux RND transporter permease subunit [Spirochaetales bacterium]|nr:efflux RND transporter permease subunit [Leptospiraceae bacterium]MCP5483121.1 efflux RND transporter permease subunit [Spirochaetales bacterium]MCP5484561.1 efflux RND transporter permease subunit [Spirochaetales bacterium]